jgi:hypothetical protein
VKRRNVLRQRAERLARQGFTLERIAKRLGLDRKQAQELLREMNGDCARPFSTGCDW